MVCKKSEMINRNDNLDYKNFSVICTRYDFLQSSKQLLG